LRAKCGAAFFPQSYPRDGRLDYAGAVPAALGVGGDITISWSCRTARWESGSAMFQGKGIPAALFDGQPASVFARPDNFGTTDLAKLMRT